MKLGHVRDDVLTSDILFENILMIRMSQSWLQVSYVNLRLVLFISQLTV